MTQTADRTQPHARTAARRAAPPRPIIIMLGALAVLFVLVTTLTAVL